MPTGEIKTAIQEHYTDVLKENKSCGCNCDCDSNDSPKDLSKKLGYTNENSDVLAVADYGLGCGTPIDHANIKEGMTVLDLGSGAGIDVFIVAKIVGTSGKVIGIDMTDAMLEKARENRLKLGLLQTEFRKGEIENMPVETNSIDRILSNCVLNLVPDKEKAFSEMFRVLKPGGSFAVSDIVTTAPVPDEVRKNLSLWAACLSGAIEGKEYLRLLKEAGFKSVNITSRKKYPTDGLLPFDVVSITVVGTKP